MKKDPKIALVLGAGGAKGVAHIGVLQELENANIHFDFIVGCSMGSIIGSCYALGATVENMQKAIEDISRNDIIDLRIPDKFGFIKGDKAENFIRNIFENSGICLHRTNTVDGKKRIWQPLFSDCKIPFHCLTTDFYKGEGVVLSSGKLLPAVRASFSIGGVFRPVKIGSKYLLDGGMISRVPVDVARELGADIVIAVDCVGPTLPIVEEDISGYGDTISRVFNIMDYGFSKDEMNSADVLISILENVSAIKFKDLPMSVEYGRKYSKEMIPKIKRVIKKWYLDNTERS